MDFVFKLVWGVLMLGLCYWIFKGAIVWAYKTPWVASLFYVFIAAFLFVFALFGFGAVFKLW